MSRSIRSSTSTSSMCNCERMATDRPLGFVTDALISASIRSPRHPRARSCGESCATLPRSSRVANALQASCKFDALFHLPFDASLVSNSLDYRSLSSLSHERLSAQFEKLLTHRHPDSRRSPNQLSERGLRRSTLDQGAEQVINSLRLKPKHWEADRVGFELLDELQQSAYEVVADDRRVGARDVIRNDLQEAGRP